MLLCLNVIKIEDCYLLDIFYLLTHLRLVCGYLEGVTGDGPEEGGIRLPITQAGTGGVVTHLGQVKHTHTLEHHETDLWTQTSTLKKIDGVNLWTQTSTLKLTEYRPVDRKIKLYS